jgi:hypothetical protein
LLICRFADLPQAARPVTQSANHSITKSPNHPIALSSLPD